MAARLGARAVRSSLRLCRRSESLGNRIPPTSTILSFCISPDQACQPSSVEDFQVLPYARRCFAKAAKPGPLGEDANAGIDFKALESDMERSVRHLHDSLSTLRVGRASPGLLDHIKVDAYGEKVPFKSLAACTVREAQLLAVTAFDPGTVDSIAKAITAAPLGLNPRVDGTDILVPVPRPDKQAVKGMNKLIQGQAESTKQAVRRLRKGAMDECKRLKSKDDQRRQEKQVQEMTDSYISQVDDIVQDKEAQLAAI
ncbi:hypothetical protein WJX74_001618 [Apatococcus lobatus]|uniref:Ribosome-recycling factor, chloroplastic n=2 Tax=Apatococcus TaxID=904362 RepID=A0AAW1T306_9CHLO